MVSYKALNTYQEYHQPKVDVEKGYNAYFDLSDGLLSAYQVEATSNCLKSVVNKVTGNASCQEVLTLKNSQIEKNELRQTELYNYITVSYTHLTLPTTSRV